MSKSVEQHRAAATRDVGCAVITVSDTRTLENDTGGQAVVDRLQQAGNQVIHRDIIPDDPERLELLVESLSSHNEVDAILITGGTGMTGRDQTFETVTRLLTKSLPGYGELFRMLSYQEIGSAAMLSRTTGGLVDRTVLLTMPGSPAAVHLAMEKIIVPELRHLVNEALR